MPFEADGLCGLNVVDTINNCTRVTKEENIAQEHVFKRLGL